MTITRVWQAGAEWNDPLTEFSSRSSGEGVITQSGTKRTGGYAVRCNGADSITRDLATGLTQLRSGVWIHHNGVASGETPSLLRLRATSGASMLRLAYDGSQLHLYSGGTVSPTLLTSVLLQSTSGAWHHLGVDVKIHASGWFYVYWDGVRVIAYEGNTAANGSDVQSLTWGTIEFANRWANYVYLDDFFVENTAGESAPAIVPNYRFDVVNPSAQGANNAWAGSDSDSVDNWALLDERPYTVDDYIESATGGAIDSSQMSNITLESGWQVNAVLPMAVALKTAAGSTLGIKLHTRTTVSGSPVTVNSAHQDVTTDYALYWARQTTRPDASAWDETTVNALEIGIVVD